MKNALWKHSCDDTGPSEGAELAFFPRSCSTDEATAPSQLPHSDAIGATLGRLFSDSLCTVNLYLPFLTRGFYPLSTRWSLFQVQISGNSKLNVKLRSCLAWGFCHIRCAVESCWWDFVSIVPKCRQAKLLFALVEISCPPRQQKIAQMWPCPWPDDL